MIRRFASDLPYSVVRDPRYFTLIAPGSSPQEAFGNLQRRGDLRTKSRYKVVAKPMSKAKANGYAQEHAHEFDGGKVVGCVPIYTSIGQGADAKIKEFELTVNAKTREEAEDFARKKMEKELKKEMGRKSLTLEDGVTSFNLKTTMISPAAKLIMKPPTVGTKYYVQGCGDHIRFSTKKEAIAYYMENPTRNLSWNPCTLLKEEDVAFLSLVPDDTLPTFRVEGDMYLFKVEQKDYLFFGLR